MNKGLLRGGETHDVYTKKHIITFHVIADNVRGIIYSSQETEYRLSFRDKLADNLDSLMNCV